MFHTEVGECPGIQNCAVFHTEVGECPEIQNCAVFHTEVGGCPGIYRIVQCSILKLEGALGYTELCSSILRLDGALRYTELCSVPYCGWKVSWDIQNCAVFHTEVGELCSVPY